MSWGVSFKESWLLLIAIKHVEFVIVTVAFQLINFGSDST